jgi:hypothetical protein
VGVNKINSRGSVREGFVARTFHIPIDVDDKLRMEAVKKRIRFSDMAILTFREYFQNFQNISFTEKGKARASSCSCRT